MTGNDFRQIGPNRYMFTWMAPWGQPIAAELLVMTARGWCEHPAASDPAWTAFGVGPAVLAIRLRSNIPARSATPPARARSLVERN